MMVNYEKVETVTFTLQKGDKIEDVMQKILTEMLLDDYNDMLEDFVVDDVKYNGIAVTVTMRRS